MFVEDICKCIVRIIPILLREYEMGRLSYAELLEQTKIKIQFLVDQKEYILDTELQSECEKIIDYFNNNIYA